MVLTLAHVKHAQRRLKAASQRHDQARENLRQSVLEAREGHTLAEIGKALGMTRQGVFDLLKR